MKTLPFVKGYLSYYGIKFLQKQWENATSYKFNMLFLLILETSIPEKGKSGRPKPSAAFPLLSYSASTART